MKNKIKEKALNKAWEIRNYEINLYWKRAVYFWVFNTSLACASYKVYFCPSDNYSESNIFLLGICILIGFACSIAWLLSNIASKRWQENWENHIDLLENEKYGRLYKTVLSKYEYFPRPSVSRLNLKISFLIFIFWLILIFCYIIQITTHPYIYLIFVGLITFHMIGNEIGNKNAFVTIVRLIWGRKDSAIYMECNDNETIKIIDLNE